MYSIHSLRIRKFREGGAIRNSRILATLIAAILVLVAVSLSLAGAGSARADEQFGGLLPPVVAPEPPMDPFAAAFLSEAAKTEATKEPCPIRLFASERRELKDLSFGEIQFVLYGITGKPELVRAAAEATTTAVRAADPEPVKSSTASAQVEQFDIRDWSQLQILGVVSAIFAFIILTVLVARTVQWTRRVD